MADIKIIQAITLLKKEIDKLKEKETTSPREIEVSIPKGSNGDDTNQRTIFIDRRPSDVRGVAPTGIEFTGPRERESAVIFLKNGLVEFWQYDGFNWILTATVQGDGNTTYIPRTDDTPNVEPTALEVPNPRTDDVALIKLGNGVVEYWHYDGATWGRILVSDDFLHKWNSTEDSYGTSANKIKFVYGSDGFIYQAMQDVVAGVDPTTETDDTNWVKVNEQQYTTNNISADFELANTIKTGWFYKFKNEHATDDVNITVQGGGTIDGEATYTLKAGDGATLFHKGVGEWIVYSSHRMSGLRGDPVADDNALKTLVANEYEKRLVTATKKEYVFKLTANLTARETSDTDNISDNLNTGKWVLEEKGLRGKPVATKTILTSLDARDDEHRTVLDNGAGKEEKYVFKKTVRVTAEETLDTNNLDDDALTGKWVLQVAKDGLRGTPTSDTTELLQLTAKDDEFRNVLFTKKDYRFKKTSRLTAEEIADLENLSDVADTGKWIYQAPPVSEDQMVNIPITDGSIDHVSWSLNPVGFDLTTAKGYIVVTSKTSNNTSVLSPLRIELPMTAGAMPHHSGLVLNNNSYEIRAVVRDGSKDVLEIAGSFDANSGHGSELLSIKYYKPQKTVIKPTEATVPTGYEVLLLEGTTNNNDTELFEFASRIPAGKRVIGLMSVLVEWNSGYLTWDTTGSINLSVGMNSKTSVKFQSKSEHHKNKPFMITLQLANN